MNPTVPSTWDTNYSQVGYALGLRPGYLLLLYGWTAAAMEVPRQLTESSNINIEIIWKCFCSIPCQTWVFRLTKIWIWAVREIGWCLVDQCSSIPHHWDCNLARCEGKLQLVDAAIDSELLFRASTSQRHLPWLCRKNYRPEIILRST